jgi:subtilisin family serine protease
MSIKHVILRWTESPPGRPNGRPGALPMAVAPTAPIAVDVAELTPRAAVDVARTDNTVVAVAPVMPMKLIAPVVVDVAAEPAANGIAWGIQAVGADTSPFTGAGITVAVLDTGIDATHPAFAELTMIQRNFTSEPDEDLNGHGTHCAGTIFGRPVDGTRIGVAPGVTRVLIGKVLGAGGGGSDVVLEAIQWALQEGAHVISMSLGIDFPGFVALLQQQQGLLPELATSIALDGYRQNVLLFERLASLVEARAAFGQPCLLVAAAGNESRREVHPNFEIAVSPPAVADGFVSVAALGQHPEGWIIATFSNTGARLSGPGVGILSARVGGGLRTLSGTSMATPHVAGVAALWAEKLRNEGQFRAPQFMDRLVASATMDGLRPGFDPADVGHGIIRAPQS